jgi:hypothetical protein
MERVASKKSLAVTNRLYNDPHACKKENCGCKPKEPTKKFDNQSANKGLNAVISKKNKRLQPKLSINTQGKSDG